MATPTLALGIGATTAMFSVVNGILLRPLPYPAQDRLVELVHEAPGAGIDELLASPAVYFGYRDHSETFESVGLWDWDRSPVMARTAMVLQLLVITGVMAAVLGLVEIYGIVSYAVSRRRREIGIRLRSATLPEQPKSPRPSSPRRAAARRHPRSRTRARVPTN